MIGNKLFDVKVDLKLRLFYVLAWTACIANTIGYATNAVMYGFSIATIFPLVCALVIYAATAYGIYTQKSRISVILILVICDFLEFPVLYCLYGPHRLSYIILGIVATALFLSDKWRLAGTLCLIVFDSIFIALRMVKADFFSTLAVDESSVSVIITFLIACCSILVMLTILIRQHEEQQKCMQTLTDELQLMAHLDPLTQLYNRRYLTQYLEKKISSQENDFSVVLLDIDDFKHINDTYGHMFGDEVLQEFSKILLKYMKGHGIATRFGGEEFMLVFHSTDKGKMHKILDQCAVDFRKYGMAAKKIEITFSGGVADFKNEDMLVKLFNIADENLYQAKNTGKKHVVYV